MDKSTIQEQLKRNLSQNLQAIMKAKNLHQTDVVDKLDSMFSISYNPGSFSKVYNGTIMPPLYIILYLAKVLECTVDDLLSPHTSGEKSTVHTSLNTLDRLTNDEHIIADPNAEEFAGIMGKFYCYFWPTHSNGTHPIIADLEFLKGEQSIEAHLQIRTGKIIAGETHEEKKEYRGYVVIAKAVETCFCLLKGIKNVSTGELCFLAFRCMHLNMEKLYCSIAEALTVSAGNSKRVPTVHRILLSRKEIQPCHYSTIMPSLYLNTSRILVKEDTILSYHDFSEYEAAIISMLKKTEPATKYWFFTEKEIKGYADRIGLPEGERNLLINKLREISENEKYNKASAEANDIVWSILRTLGY